MTVALSLLPRSLRGNGGFSLLELLISLSILSIVAVVLSVLLVGTLQSQGFSSRQDDLVQTARLVMERIVAHTKRANQIQLPSVGSPTGNRLQFTAENPQGENLQYAYSLDTATNILREAYPINTTTTVTTDLAEQVATFQVQRLTGENGAPLIDIFLRLQDDKGHGVELQTRAFPRNVQN